MSDHPDVETRGELKRLEEFANTLKKGSVVHSKIVPVIAAITRDLATHDSQSKNEVWALKLQVTVGTTVGLRNIALNKTSTLIDIKSLVENQPQALSVDRIKVKRTGRAWTQFDTRTIVDCEIINGDELLIDCTAKAQKQFDKNVTGLARIENCDVKLNAAIDLLVAAIHCFILDLGFTCVMELPSTVPGFAPSLRGKGVHNVELRSNLSVKSFLPELCSPLIGSVLITSFASCTSTRPSLASSLCCRQSSMRSMLWV